LFDFFCLSFNSFNRSKHSNILSLSFILVKVFFIKVILVAKNYFDKDIITRCLFESGQIVVFSWSNILSRKGNYTCPKLAIVWILHP